MSFNPLGMQGVFGWRGVVGYVAPSSCERLAWEFYAHAPEGVALQIVTLPISEISDEQVAAALDRTEAAAVQVQRTGAQYVCLAGTPLVVLRGYRWGYEWVKRMELASGVPCSATILDAEQALKALNVRRLVMASPLEPRINIGIEAFFGEAGFEVLCRREQASRFNRDIRLQPMHAAYELGKAAFLAAPTAEAIYMPCGGWGGPPVIEALERDLGVPVITSNQVFLWAALRRLSIGEPVRGYGRLFRDAPTRPAAAKHSSNSSSTFGPNDSSRG